MYTLTCLFLEILVTFRFKSFSQMIRTSEFELRTRNCPSLYKISSSWSKKNTRTTLKRLNLSGLGKWMKNATQYHTIQSNHICSTLLYSTFFYFTNTSLLYPSLLYFKLLQSTQLRYELLYYTEKQDTMKIIPCSSLIYYNLILFSYFSILNYIML